MRSCSRSHIRNCVSYMRFPTPFSLVLNPQRALSLRILCLDRIRLIPAAVEIIKRIVWDFDVSEVDGGVVIHQSLRENVWLIVSNRSHFSPGFVAKTCRCL